ncbi:uncharacterized protein KQ657_002290 [Scheffersomyces spartinae]|uniref:XPG N-terminal domain-containing protein n=1 Tax=Scheffersomyces spartinae TaxID=45513 RepID=A0A9P7VDN8_9ASCO|nr:uncharacterized protein KQ657_002290 [Scheffersomyces spartinae]KAG7195905.1 hypothetical protein KQ657_002290 [Scheffersomyces spartinae]
MPITSLESFLFERKLVSSCPIEILQNSTIGIDVDHYLYRIYTFKKEQFLPGIGGVPSSLKDYIHLDLQVFKEFNIKPIFVIPGMKIQIQKHDYKTGELSQQEQHIETTWMKLSNKPPYSYNNMESFRLYSESLPVRPMIHDLITYFIDIGVDYMVAPYDVSFQLSYLYQNNIIDIIYGSTDLLLTQLDKFILGMEFQSKDFRFIDKAKVLHDLSLSERQLMDLSILVGCELQPTMFPIFPPIPKPNLTQPYPQLSYFKMGLDIIYQYSYNNNSNDLYGFIMGLQDPTLLELYQKGHTALKCIPVMNKDGYVELYNVEMAKLGIKNNIDFLEHEKEPESEESTSAGNVVKVPNDVHDIISQRLPPEFYFYQSIGLLPVGLLEAITQGQLHVRPPLESSLNDNYKRLVTSKFYTESLDRQFNLITQLLTRYYGFRKINVKFWFRDEEEKLNNRMFTPVSKMVEKLFIQEEESSNEFNLTKFWTQLNGGSFTAVKNKKITSVSDIISTILLRVLYLYGIVDNKTLKLTNLGKIFQRFVQENPESNNINNLMLLLLLIKTQTIRFDEINNEFTSVPKFFKELSNDESISFEKTKLITMIARVFTLVKLNISPINYQGPISRGLLNFRSFVGYVSNDLIHLFECLLVDFIVHEENNDLRNSLKNKQDWYQLISQLPFYKEVPNTLLGVMVEIYFEYSIRQAIADPTKSKQDIIKNTKDHLLNFVYQVNNTSFNINVNGINSIKENTLFEDFGIGLTLWNDFVKMMIIANDIDNKLVSDNYLESVNEANKLVKEFI